MRTKVEDIEAEEFHRGYGEGLSWAREYATAEELSAYVRVDGDARAFERGFRAGCEEVLLEG